MLSLKINLKKSKLVRVGNRSDQEDHASVLGYKVAKFPIRCLGIPLGVRYKDERVWDPVMEVFEKRLAGWIFFKGGKTNSGEDYSGESPYILSICLNCFGEGCGKI